MMTDEQILLAEIDAFLDATAIGGRRRMAESTFGFKAANDGKLVGRLRDGKTLTFEKARQIRLFMTSAPAEFSREPAGAAA